MNNEVLNEKRVRTPRARPISAQDGDAEGPTVRGVARNADPSGKAGQIAAEIERRLLVGEYEFGQALSIIQLAREFGVSRQPVSVAISHLRSSGYVEIIPQVECRVVAPSAGEIADFFVALGKIESAAASFAAERHSTLEAKRLIKIGGRAVPKSLGNRDDREAYIADVDAFHDQLWRMARSPALEGRVSSLRRLSNFYLWQGAERLAPDAAETLILERREIARLIQMREVRGAEILMEQHISRKPYVSGIL